ncbi:WD40-repeat-containing domain protein [Piptocephalis cylindrospora]|uniref:WD40-repeat-containing domain protein n=1 Tax=Piptocephalis cylindrospora TaxID=1907219 RepID=A0A4P9Y7P0_9FUNG|nr:WD40-repeat-containing domain protein [Piptocephalis cylindrospora]|eukprot:RKP15073.1 WD40-repeat-containing domain protein [Piptocephalis cylindrospora]
MGEFEDVFEDEFEEEETGNATAMGSDSDSEEEEEGIMQEEDDEETKEDLKVYLPGQALDKDEVLEVDNSAYMMLHNMSVQWPCLSFDVLQDNLGADRTRFPHTAYLVAGTQAERASDNEILVMKMSQLHRTNRDDQDQQEDGDSDDEAVDDDPVLEHHSVKHPGGVNRIRLMPGDQGAWAATWADTGKVHIWNLNPQAEALASPGHIPSSSTPPVHTIHSHEDEGFAMDWSSMERGRLLTGDMTGQIRLTTENQGQWTTDPRPFLGHTSSVEDIQWSHKERTVFASCSADRTVRIWDTRMPSRAPALSYYAHNADVNVISWNRRVDYLMASGGDDGVFSVWDMRALGGGKPAPIASPKPVASFQWHKAPITSIEWSPHEESVLALSGADDQCTIWDLSVEEDKEEEASTADSKVPGPEVPPQLLFIHQGQQDIKEIHWHKQIKGCIVTTASSGFNIFRTISV